MQPNDITFFQRFQDDILAGRKTITIRDAAESHFKTGDVLRVRARATPSRRRCVSLSLVSSRWAKRSSTGSPGGAQTLS